MLEHPLATLPLNGPLVAQARGMLTRVPLAEYIYNRMLRSAVVQSLPEWTVADNAGPAGGHVFELRDGKPLNTGVPGIFTWNGYHSVFLPLLPQVTKDASEDGWVLGRQQKGGVAASVAEMSQLRRDVMGLYLDDYTRRWDALLGNVALKPFGNLSQGLDELYLLSAPDSAAARPAAGGRRADRTQPAGGDREGGRAGGGEGGQGRQEGRRIRELHGARRHDASRRRRSPRSSARRSAPMPRGKPVDPATRVDEHFRGLHEFVAGAKDKPAQLEAVIGKIQQIYQGMSQAANAPNQGQALLEHGGGRRGGGRRRRRRRRSCSEIAQSVPKPVAAMLQTVSQSSAQVTASGASSSLADAWRSKVLPLCQAAFNRYPFIAGSAQDVPLDDFTHLLGPGGLMDQFFDQIPEAVRRYHAETLAVAVGRPHQARPVGRRRWPSSSAPPISATRCFPPAARRSR